MYVIEAVTTAAAAGIATIVAPGLLKKLKSARHTKPDEIREL